jgi:RND family efflux transporter MFP subunit
MSRHADHCAAAGGASLSAIAAAFLACAACSQQAPTPSEPSVLVHVMPLHKGSLPSVVTVFGTVEASAAARQTIMAPTGAVVADIPVRLGERVAKGAPLIRLAPTPQTAASFAQARSALTVATQLARRTRQLLGQHLATRQQLADAEKSAADARAALDALRAQGAGGTSALTAPSRVIVTAISTSRGAVVSEGTPLLELARTSGLVLHAGIVPTAAHAIAPGNAAAITPVGGTRSVEGTVSLSGTAVDPATGLTPVEITVPAGTLQPGEMAEAAITTGSVSGYLVPHEAILVDDSGNPYVVQDVKGAAKKSSVRVTASQGDRDIITGALDPDAPLVLAGNYQLQDGMKVRIARPAGTGQ